MLSDDQPRSHALAATAHLVLRQRNLYRSQVRRIGQQLLLLEQKIKRGDITNEGGGIELAYGAALDAITAIVNEAPPIQTQETEELDEA